MAKQASKQKRTSNSFSSKQRLYTMGEENLTNMERSPAANELGTWSKLTVKALIPAGPRGVCVCA